MKAERFKANLLNLYALPVLLNSVVRSYRYALAPGSQCRMATILQLDIGAGFAQIS